MKVYLWSLKNREQVYKVFKNIGVDNSCWDLMADKSETIKILIDKLSMAGANVLKQSALSLGAEAAVAGGVINGKVKYSKVLLIGTIRQLLRVAENISIQQFHLMEVSKKIAKILKNLKEYDYWEIANGKITFNKPIITGILNLTPDSFYDGGKITDVNSAVKYCRKMIEEGADIIDLGGESSRPGSLRISLEEEKRRVLPVIQKIRKKFDIPISIDTVNAETADIALKEGCNIINDITGFENKNMIKVAEKHKAGLIVMHKQGNPENMQKGPKYGNVFIDIGDYLNNRIDIIEKFNIDRESIVVDPGFGFGKNIKHNLSVFNHLRDLKSYVDRPIYIGVSRKSMIKDLNGGEKAEDRLAGSIALAVLSLTQGVKIFRVHDVLETRKALDVAYKTLINEE